LPLDVRLGCHEEPVRRESVRKCVTAVCVTRCLDPFAYILHCCWEGDDGGAAWVGVVDRSIRELLDAGIEPARLCVENLDYPFERLEGVIRRHGLSVCLDVGHVWLNGFSLDDYLQRYLGLCRVVHLHGIRDGRDHRDLSAVDGETLAGLLDEISSDGKPRVVTLEVFNRMDLERSLEVVGREITRLCAAAPASGGG
jgi:sugar phosphate isomerase/epimerase